MRSDSNTFDLIIVGAGAAGLMAALIAARDGLTVLLIEKNKRIGRKLAITGGGRCNLTNQVELQELIANIPGNGRFLFGAMQRFGPQQLQNFVETELGVQLKVERGRRVFPLSDQATEVVEAFQRKLAALGVRLITNSKVTAINRDSTGNIIGVTCVDGQSYRAGQVIIATGGLAYPGTGSTGDGLAWAEACGHSIVPCYPSLVPLETLEDWPLRLEGLSLINVAVTAYHQGRKLAADFGEMLFTSYGVSGPIILSLSRAVAPLVTKEPNSITLSIDLKPALNFEELDLRIQRDFNSHSNKIFKNALDELLPQKLIPVIIDLAAIDPLKTVHQITKGERRNLVNLLKNLNLTIKRTRSFNEAIVTMGGVNVKELNPKTMESKKVNGLFFVGEVVDVDGFTGGYNLQIAFTMGFIAAKTAAERMHQPVF